VGISLFLVQVPSPALLRAAMPNNVLAVSKITIHPTREPFFGLIVQRPFPNKEKNSQKALANFTS
jgi:hypothetical protein